jgi:alpha-tubulin suppressor-like RCC1 family protein
MTQQPGHPRQSAAGPRRAASGLAVSGLAVSAAAAAMALAGAPVSAAGASPGPRAAAHAAGGTTIWGWGDGSAGELGRKLPAATTSIPVRARLPLGTRIASVRAGCLHTVALTVSGRVLTWGSNTFGQLGRKTAGVSSATPAKVTFPAGTGKIIAVRAGCEFTLALTSTGQVLAWGDNFFHQLGNGTDGQSSAPTPVSLPPGTKVTAITAGSAYSLALTAAGEVLAWGDNSDGQLGTGDTTAQPGPVQVQLPPHVTATGIAAGFLTSHVITRSGGVLSWGDGGSGELGNGTASLSLAPVPAMLPQGTRVKGLFAGCDDTIALTTAGKVWAWGSNQFGQLGDNSTEDGLTPVQARLPRGTTVTAIGAGCEHVLARTASGRVLAWGFNGDGQIGDGTGARIRRLPVRVTLPGGVAASSVASGPNSDSSLAIS